MRVSATKVISASPERSFTRLTDPGQHPLIDGTGSVLAVQPGGPERLTPGARFGMDMKIGAPYTPLPLEGNALVGVPQSKAED